MRELHLFAGIGGGIIAGQMLGHRCVGAVEIEPYCRRVLEARQQDGHLEQFPIHDDIRTFDGTTWRGRVDLVAGGFPCTDISIAGKGAGLAGKDSGLWREMLRVVREVEPGLVFVENSPMLRTRGLATVLHDLALLGFDAEWGVLSAADVGAPHLRKRMWILAAHPDRWRREGFGLEEHAGIEGAQRHEPDGLREAGRRDREAVADADGERGPSRSLHATEGARRGHACGGGIGQAAADAGRAGLPLPGRDELRGAGRRDEGRATAELCRRAAQSCVGIAHDGIPGWLDGDWERGVPRTACGVPDRVKRLKALGNAQVPLQAATAFRLLLARLAR